MNEKILVVDDEPEILETISEFLTAEGFRVTTAASGEDALACIAADSFPLMITDMKMPGLSGLDLLRKVKTQDEDTEVIVLTGYGTLENAIEALRNGGAYDYLRKPLEYLDDLSCAVINALTKRQLRLENKSLCQLLQKANAELEEKAKEREQLVAELQAALAEIKTLHGIVPICASCKKIRDAEGVWHQLEAYISKRTDAQFSHGICKDCMKKLYPEYCSDDESETT